MATKNRRGRNNNPQGHNQYTGWMDTARERPMAAAAAAAVAVGAGVFLWSRRDQISNQLTELSDQVGQWTESMQSKNEERQFETAGTSLSMDTDESFASTPSAVEAGYKSKL